MKIEHARNIARTRKAYGLTKTQFAEILDVSRNTLSRIEAFAANDPVSRYPYLPSSTTAVKVAAFLETEVESLLTKKDMSISVRYQDWAQKQIGV